jgi:hypothetical protein
MSLKEKIANAKTTNWLSKGFSQKELERIKKSAKEKMDKFTKDDAIKTLKSKMDGHTDTSWEWTETVRMAINALEEQKARTIKTTDNGCGFDEMSDYSLYLNG